MTAGHKSVQAFIWALCLIAGSAFAQTALPACQGSDVSRWTNCVGTGTFSNGDKYVGEYKDGNRNGLGTFYNQGESQFKGDKYVGEFKGGQFNGQGTYTSANGDEYGGQFKDNYFNGQGTYYFQANNRFKGDKYVGEYKDGKRNGQGTYTFANGNKHVGEWMDDKPNGQGIEYHASGSVTKQGRWENGNLVQSFAIDAQRFPFNPPTQIASAQPSTPERDRLAAVAQSQIPECRSAYKHNCVGTQTFVGGKYVGEFKDNIPNGQGTVTNTDGSTYFGEFKDNKLNGQGTFTFANGNKYVGEFKDGLYNGQGTFTFASGWKYVGEFKGDSFNGQGVEYRASGKVEKQGRWENGNLVQSFAIDAQRFPFNSSLTASATQAPVLDPVKAERDRLAAELEASRKNAKDLEERLAAAQALTNNPPNLSQPVAANVRSAHALVIGNAAYPGSGRLDNPVNDAKAISQKLRSMGFTVTTVTDANRQKLVQSMAQFRRTAAAADISLLFYSGHGVQIFGTNYMLPTDVDQTDPAQATIQGVSLNSVVENFLPGKTKLVFLDACRDNALQRTTDRSVSKGLAPISAAEGTLISYATKDGQTASDGVGAKNSPFTQALLQHLDDPADIAVVLRKVREKVMLATAGKQQPWEYGSLTGGELVLSKIKGGR